MSSKPLIRLWFLENLGLIILKETGVLVSNQTCGLSCLQPEAEGIFVPLLEQDFTRGIEGLFEGWENIGITEAKADLIDAYLAQTANGALHFLKVDRTRLDESHEAWIFVDVDEPERDGNIMGFGKTKGILTWPNSD